MFLLTNDLRDCPTRRLGDVATVRLGFTPLKEKRSDYASASNQRPSQPFVRRTVLMVQPSNITDEGTIDWRRLERIDVQPKQNSYDNHTLKPGSVLLCLRGVMRVANLTEQTLQQDRDATAEPLPIVASGAWAVITPDTQALTTDYLTWHLRQPSTAARLHEERAGSALQFIPLSVVQDMTLPLPRRDTQAALVRAADLIDQVAKLERQRLELLRSYLAGSIQTHSPVGRVARTGKPKNRGTSAS
jgi:hypothetical protein